MQEQQVFPEVQEVLECLEERDQRTMFGCFAFFRESLLLPLPWEDRDFPSFLLLILSYIYVIFLSNRQEQSESSEGALTECLQLQCIPSSFSSCVWQSERRLFFQLSGIISKQWLMNILGSPSDVIPISYILRSVLMQDYVRFWQSWVSLSMRVSRNEFYASF